MFTDTTKTQKKMVPNVESGGNCIMTALVHLTQCVLNLFSYILSQDYQGILD